MRFLPAVAVGVGLALAVAPSATAQSWRLRLDAAGQRVGFRGVIADSIPEADALTGLSSGKITPDGFAVNCFNDGYCHYWRPGELRRGVPATLTSDLTMWGFGISGLRVRVRSRLHTDLTGDRLWPGSSPTTQVQEAYAEYIRDGWTFEGGRIPDHGRLGNSALGAIDGGRAALRLDQVPLDLSLYGGWGFARGTLLSVTSPAVNPLLDYAPEARQLVAGATLGAHLPRVNAEVEYRREVDPVSDYFVSERAALSVQFRPTARVRLTGGGDYDLAQGNLGTAEVALAYTAPRLWATVGARHYRPFFDLWTVWGVFSPTPYRGVNGTLGVGITSKIQVRGSGEWFRYDAAGATTPTVTIEDRGWRAGLEATVTPVEGWTVQGGAHSEFLPGASSRGVDGRVTWRMQESWTVSVQGGALERPLELRFQDAGVTWLGAAADYRVADRWNVGATVDRYWESRDRPDAAAFDWNQWRMGVRASLTLRSEPDRWSLPPGRPRQVTP